MVALLTSVRNSPCFGGLRRTKTCHRQLFARPSMLFGYFLHDAKSDNPFPLQGASRFCKPRISAPKQRLRTNPIKSFCRPWRHYLCASRYYQRLRRFFSALRQCPCRDGTLRVLFRRHRRLFFPPAAVPCCCRNIFCRPWRLFFSFTKLLRRHAKIMLEHFGKL